MRIGTDLDGVLADFPSTFLEQYINPALESRNQKTITTDDIKHWEFEKSIPLNPMVTDTLYRKAIAEGIFRFLPTYHNGLVTLLQELDLRGHTIYYITSRDQGTSEDTYEWLNSTKLPFSGGVYFTKNKARVCELLGIDIMLEDLYEQANEIADKTEASVLLIKRPWNTEMYSPYTMSMRTKITNSPATDLENLVLGPRCDF